MSNRQVIEIDGLSHTNPIPLAARVGPLLVSGGITGKNRETGQLGDDLESQCSLMFENIRAIVAAAGGSTDDIVKLTVWLKDAGNKKPLNTQWLEMFPDENSRPARHTFGNPDLAGDILVQAEIMAVLD